MTYVKTYRRRSPKIRTLFKIPPEQLASKIIDLSSAPIDVERLEREIATNEAVLREVRGNIARAIARKVRDEDIAEMKEFRDNRQAELEILRYIRDIIRKKRGGK